MFDMWNLTFTSKFTSLKLVTLFALIKPCVEAYSLIRLSMSDSKTDKCTADFGNTVDVGII